MIELAFRYYIAREQRIGEITAKETSALGIDWTFAPTVAVARDDRWGRTYESYCEDPHVVAKLGAAQVRLNRDDDIHVPLYPVGYGLTYSELR